VSVLDELAVLGPEGPITVHTAAEVLSWDDDEEVAMARRQEAPKLEYIVVVDGDETPDSPYNDVVMAAFAAQAAKLDDLERSVAMLVEVAE